MKQYLMLQKEILSNLKQVEKTKALVDEYQQRTMKSYEQLTETFQQSQKQLTDYLPWLI